MKVKIKLICLFKFIISLFFITFTITSFSQIKAPMNDNFVEINFDNQYSFVIPNNFIKMRINAIGNFSWFFYKDSRAVMIEYEEDENIKATLKSIFKLVDEPVFLDVPVRIGKEILENDGIKKNTISDIKNSHIGDGFIVKSFEYKGVNDGNGEVKVYNLIVYDKVRDNILHITMHRFNIAEFNILKNSLKIKRVE